MPKIHNALVLSMLLAGALAGCSPSPRAAEPVSTQSNRHQQIIALINGSPITQSQLTPNLNERVGHHALFDLILDRQLDLEAQRLGLHISQQDIDHEAALLVRTITDIDHPDRGYTLLSAVRSTRGLGPHRYPRLLRRNAILRKLAADTAPPSDSEYRLAERIAFGQTYRVRLFVSETRTTATALRHALLDAPSDALRWMFADACTTDSIHPSASRGGLIPNLSTTDPAYPQVLNEAIESAPIGALSGVLSTDAGFALVLVESKANASTPSPEHIRSVKDQLALRKQSLEMQRIADRLVRDADVIVMDRALNWSWTNQK